MRIGITGPDDFGEYARAVERAGGTTLKLENDLTRLDDYLTACDGIILSGGHDLSEAHGGAPSPNQTYEPTRDAFELALARRLKLERIPTLGICRGLQLLNVAFGGTLTPDIHGSQPDIPPTAHQPKNADNTKNRALIKSHIVTLADGLLAKASQSTTFATTSRHHQAIATLSPAFHVVGRTPDRIIEAIEANFNHPWFAAVQWHPETSASNRTTPQAAPSSKPSQKPANPTQDNGIKSQRRKTAVATPRATSPPTAPQRPPAHHAVNTSTTGSRAKRRRQPGSGGGAEGCGDHHRSRRSGRSGRNARGVGTAPLAKPRQNCTVPAWGADSEVPQTSAPPPDPPAKPHRKGNTHQSKKPKDA